MMIIHVLLNKHTYVQTMDRVLYLGSSSSTSTSTSQWSPSAHYI